jgi:hypothetical protein
MVKFSLQSYVAIRILNIRSFVCWRKWMSRHHLCRTLAARNPNLGHKGLGYFDQRSRQRNSQAADKWQSLRAGYGADHGLIRVTLLGLYFSQANQHCEISCAIEMSVYSAVFYCFIFIVIFSPFVLQCFCNQSSSSVMHFRMLCEIPIHLTHSKPCVFDETSVYSVMQTLKEFRTSCFGTT